MRRSINRGTSALSRSIATTTRRLFCSCPRALRLITTDFFQLRAIWFALQALVFAGVIAGLGVWIGEAIGAYTLVGGLFVLSAPSVIFSLQMGNFQTTAMALGALAFVFLLTRREARGGIVLAYLALSKIFPGLLVVHLLFARRWRAVAWTGAAALVLIALSIWVVGTGPWLDFLHHEVPGIMNGKAFPQSEKPNVVESNQSIYGLMVRLRYLGAGWLDQPLGLRAASVYGLLILGLAAFAGWKGRLSVDRAAGRLMLVQTAVALMSLASFRSPFVGGTYGLVSTLWLLTLLCAGATTRTQAVLWTLAFCVCAVGNYLTPSPTFAPTPFWLIASAGILAFAVAASVWTVMRSVSRSEGAEVESAFREIAR